MSKASSTHSSGGKALASGHEHPAGPRGSSTTRSAPSRRTVVRAGVWTVPAVATVAAAPAFATSGTPVTVCLNGQACSLGCHGKTNSYRLVLSFVNNTSSTVTVQVLEFNISGAPATTFSPSSFSLSPGTHSEVFTVATGAAAQHNGTVTFQVGGQVTTAPIHFGSFHSC